MKYFGTKPYSQSYRDEGVKDVGKFTTYKMEGLIPGFIYNFTIYGSSVCGDGAPNDFPDRVKTKMAGKLCYTYTVLYYITTTVKVKTFFKSFQTRKYDASREKVTRVNDCRQTCGFFLYSKCLYNMIIIFIFY